MTAEQTNTFNADWIGGAPADLRIWRDSQPDVTRPVLPPDVAITEVPTLLGGGLMCKPPDAKPGTVVHFHGGGFVTGSPHTHRCVGARLAKALERQVWLCPYPLAPEFVLPEQSLAAAAALRTALAVHGSPLILSGDSAGALMALWSWSLSEPSVRQAVDATVLFYGYFGQEPTTGSEADGLGPQSIAAMQHRLDPVGYMRSDPLHDPLDENFSLPKHVVIVGASDDPLNGNSSTLARMNPTARHVMANNCGHGFLSVANLSQAAQMALTDVVLAMQPELR